MDNKITKRRLSRFFTYEWFVLVAVIVAVILAWEFLFSLTSVKLTRDDRFYYYYDISMDDGNATEFYNQITGKNSIFSYGVQEVTDTILFGDYTQFNAFITALDGDAMFTNIRIPDKLQGDYKENQANKIIDGYNSYSFEKLIEDAISYLKKYVKDGDNPLDKTKIDSDLVKTNFTSIMANDNRFRTNEEKEKGVLLEKTRIERLMDATTRLKWLLETHPEYFYRYTRYEQSYNLAEKGSRDKELYESWYKSEQEQTYALKLEMLTGGQKNVNDYFKMFIDETAKDAVLVLFDYISEQPNFQFESIFFIDYIVNTYSNIYM